MTILNKTVHESIKQDDLCSLAKYYLFVDKTGLIEVFNRLLSIKEQLTAYIGYYYIQFPNLRNQDCFSHDDRTCIYSISIIFYQHLINQVDMFMHLCVALAIRKIEILIDNKCHSLRSYDISPIYLKQLVPVDIRFKKGRYLVKDIIIYEFSHKDTIEDYFYELTSDETINNIEKYFDVFLSKRPEIEAIANKVCSKYNFIEFSIIDGIILKINTTQDYIDSKYKYLIHTAIRLIAFPDVSEKNIESVCESLAYCVDYKYICNGLEILDTLQAVYKKLNIKDPTCPAFKCSNVFSLTTGEFGVGYKSKGSLYKQLLSALNQIYAAVNVVHCPLKQVIIHINAYIIEFSDKIIFKGKVYRIFQLKYFGKARLAVTDEYGIRVSHRLRRHILKGWDRYMEFIDEINKYFEIDKVLLESIFKYKKEVDATK